MQFIVSFPKLSRRNSVVCFFGALRVNNVYPGKAEAVMKTVLLADRHTADCIVPIVLDLAWADLGIDLVAVVVLASFSSSCPSDIPSLVRSDF